MRIRELRVSAGLTQQELAEKLKVTQSVIAAWEREAYYPSAKKIPAIAKSLSVKMEELFTSDETA